MEQIISNIRNMIRNICQHAIVSDIIDDYSADNSDYKLTNRTISDEMCQHYTNDQLDLFEHLLVFIMDKHRHQLDKIGDQYYKHPVMVLYICLSTFKITFNELSDIIKLCLLHDIIEDTDTSFSELSHYGVNEKQLSLLTKSKNTPYFRYINDISRSVDIVVICVKISDLIHNLDVSRLSKLDNDTYTKLYNKYSPVLRLLYFKYIELSTGVHIPTEEINANWTIQE